MPLSSWIRFSASRSKLFKWLPKESADLTAIKHSQCNENEGEHTTNFEKMQNGTTIIWNNLHFDPSDAPCCNSILVRERLLLSTATSNGDNPSLFKLLWRIKKNQPPNLLNYYLLWLSNEFFAFLWFVRSFVRLLPININISWFKDGSRFFQMTIFDSRK